MTHNPSWPRLSCLWGAVLCVLAGCAAEDSTVLRAPVDSVAWTGDVVVATSAADAQIDRAVSTVSAASGDGAVAVATSMPQAGEAAEDERPVRVLVRDDAAFRRFEDTVAPRWPFVGVVQLWTSQVMRPEDSSDADEGWSLRYWGLDSADGSGAQVPLEGFEVECLGRLALVSFGPDGVEVGEVVGSGGGSFAVPWEGQAQRLNAPTPGLSAEARERSSNVDVSVSGDIVTLASGGVSVDYAMRVPPRAGGDWWRVQARHDGDLFVLTVHPSHLECYSGVTWLSIAATGEVVACGANTWATRYVDARSGPVSEPVLPDPDDVGTYLECAPRLELSILPVRLESHNAQ